MDPQQSKQYQKPYLCTFAGTAPLVVELPFEVVVAVQIHSKLRAGAAAACTAVFSLHTEPARKMLPEKYRRNADERKQVVLEQAPHLFQT